MSDSAPEAPRPRGRRGLVVVVLCTAATLAAGGGVVLARDGDPDSAAAALPDQFDRDGAAQAALTGLASSLDSGDRQGFLDFWAPDAAAQEQAAMLFDNLRALRVDLGLDVSLTYQPAAGQAGVATPVWEGIVDVDWRVRGVASPSAQATVDVVFTLGDDGPRVVEVNPADLDRVPMWLSGHLAVVRSPHRVVAAADPDLVAGLAHEVAVGQRRVARTLGRKAETVVVYLPEDADAYRALLDGAPGEYDDIAAVSTTVDGAAAGPARLVAVNPDAYAAMDDTGRQVVVTHEITHLAAGWSTAVPAWLREGFADYTALRFERAAWADASAAARRDVENRGAPRRLPDDEAFDFGAGRLERSYEYAWLAVRMLAEQHGRARVVALYRRVVAGPGGVDAQLRTTMGISLAAVTRSWRVYLEELADGA